MYDVWYLQLADIILDDYITRKTKSYVYRNGAHGILTVVRRSTKCSGVENQSDKQGSIVRMSLASRV